MNKRFGCRVTYYEQCSDRIISIRLNMKYIPTTIIQVYMPTSTSDDAEVEEVYEQINEIIKYLKGDENLILIGDWNATVGEGKTTIFKKHLND
ncbi:MAG: hypothetical protein ACEY3F_01185 [Wolbachia sp.]